MVSARQKVLTGMANVKATIFIPPIKGSFNNRSRKRVSKYPGQPCPRLNQAETLWFQARNVTPINGRYQRIKSALLIREVENYVALCQDEQPCLWIYLIYCTRDWSIAFYFYFWHKKSSFTGSRIQNSLRQVDQGRLTCQKQKRSMVELKLVGIVLILAERSLSFVMHHCSYRVSTLLAVVERSHLIQMHKA
jgi:hypothetical protein